LPEKVWSKKHSTTGTCQVSFVAKAKTEGLLNTLSAVRDKLAASQTLGYSAFGL